MDKGSSVTVALESILANKRRLHLQGLDVDALTLIRQALQIYGLATTANLADLRRQRALDRVKGRAWDDAGALIVKTLNGRLEAISRLLEALD